MTHLDSIRDIRSLHKLAEDLGKKTETSDKKNTFQKGCTASKESIQQIAYRSTTDSSYKNQRIARYLLNRVNLTEQELQIARGILKSGSIADADHMKLCAIADAKGIRVMAILGGRGNV